MPASVIGTTLFGLVFWFGAPVVVRALGYAPKPRSRIWLVMGIASVAVSWYLPSPWFTDSTVTFSQHAVGGGVASACVAYYFISHVPSTTFIQRGMVVLAVTSVLGVGNELLELVLDEVRGTRLTADAAWDLFANTVGALAAFVAFELALSVFRRRQAQELPA